jgi:hypothetical protein
MSNRTRASHRVLAAIAGAAALLLAQPVQASAQEEPPGNRGTVKIHESTTPDSDRRNEPKVCTFRIVGFGFPGDANIELSIEGHGGPNAGTGSFADTIEAGELSPEGDWAIAGPTLADGMYKLTADNTTAPGNAKHKVFKVECASGGQPNTGGESGGNATGGADVAPNTVVRPTGDTTDVLGANVERQALPATGRGLNVTAVVGVSLVLLGLALTRRATAIPPV